jgi:hypothetical protein
VRRPGRHTLLACCIGALCGVLCAQGPDGPLLAPHPYMREAVVEHNGGTATVKADYSRPLQQAIVAVSQEYGWDVNYEDPPYEGKRDVIDLINPNYRAQHPDARVVPGAAGGAFESSYPETPNMWSSTNQERPALEKIVADYNRSGNPGHFVVGALADGSFDVVGDGTHDDQGAEVPTTPILDTPISVPVATRSFADAVDVIMKAVGAKTGLKMGGLLFIAPGAAEEMQVTMGSADAVPARDLLMQLSALGRLKLRWQLLYFLPPTPFSYAIDFHPVSRAMDAGVEAPGQSATAVRATTATRPTASAAMPVPGRDVAIVAPNDAQFDSTLDSLFPGVSELPEFRAVRPLVVIVKNDSAFPVNAFGVRWIVDTPNGTTSDIEMPVVQGGGGRPEANGSALTGEHAVLRPRESELVSPYFHFDAGYLEGFLNASRLSGVGAGGIFRAAAGEPLLAEIKGGASVQTSLDGVLFADGVFAGPDASKLCERVQSEQQAGVDEGKWILSILGTGLTDQQIKDKLSEQIYAGASVAGMDPASLYRAALGRQAKMYLGVLDGGQSGLQRTASLMASATPMSIQKQGGP